MDNNRFRSAAAVVFLIALIIAGLFLATGIFQLAWGLLHLLGGLLIFVGITAILYLLLRNRWQRRG